MSLLVSLVRPLLSSSKVCRKCIVRHYIAGSAFAVLTRPSRQVLRSARANPFQMGLRRIVSLVLCIATMTGAALAVPQAASNPFLARTHFREWTAPRTDGSLLHYFINDPSPRGPRPLVVYIEGSGCNSLFRVNDGVLRYGLYAIVAGMCQEARVVGAEKRGVPFGYRGQGGTGLKCPPEYTEWATRAQRVEDVCRMLDALEAGGLVSSPVLVIGHSEGADVAAAVAARRPDVTHLAFLAGGGPTQMFDAVVLERRRLQAEGKSPAEIEAAVEALEAEFRKIQSDPMSTTKYFSGHAYRRWSGYIASPPLESLLRTKAKLFVAHGTDDNAVPIESADLLSVELIRHGRNDVTFRRIPGADHGFNTATGSLLEGLLADVIRWAGIR